YGNPVAHNLGLMTHALPFARALRTRNVYSASSADQLPQMLAAFRMFGHLALIPVPDLDRTDCLLLVGPTPAVSNRSLMTVLHVVFAEERVRLGRFEGRVSHLDALAALVRELPPERVARATGVDPGVVRRLASEFARTPRAACYGRIGLCTQRHGTLAVWLA